MINFEHTPASDFISILGSKGMLSNGLKAEVEKNNKLNVNSADFQFKKIVVATFSPTLRSDTKKAYKKEIDYYKSLINKNKANFIIFISSQTIEMTNNTYYSQAKADVEDIILASISSVAIIRPGMIFDTKSNRYTLQSMNKSANSIFTLFNDQPKITICSIVDIYKIINCIALNQASFDHKILSVGLKKYKFKELQNIKHTQALRIPIVSQFLLERLSIFSPRVKAYTTGRALRNSPNICFPGFLDKFNY